MGIFGQRLADSVSRALEFLPNRLLTNSPEDLTHSPRLHVLGSQHNPFFFFSIRAQLVLHELKKVSLNKLDAQSSLQVQVYMMQFSTVKVQVSAAGFCYVNQGVILSVRIIWKDFSENLEALGTKPGSSGSVARTSDT
uniref:Uncharacterized protein n=1 Tax=Timema bartmani TaxID=61472 RepID=A0A7R9F477_9NEOP|nr:unnamed protein product [Timema bartmani]